MKPLYTEDKIEMNTTKEKLWEALTSSAYTVKYMYGCRLECSWNIGDPMLWIGDQDGITYVKGYLLEMDLNHKLVYSVFDSNANYPDIEENYLQVEYKLEATDSGVLLTVRQGDYNRVAKGAFRYQHSIKTGGFTPILKVIKILVE